MNPFISLSPGQVLDEVHTIFGEIEELNVVFVIDSSGSMHKSLQVIKKHIVETLMKMARNTTRKHKFNLIHFNEKVHQWADVLIDCTISTVTVATRWIRSIEISVGSELSKALAAAFSCSDVNAVYLVTDGYAAEDRSRILNNIRYVSNGRPIHTIYITQVIPPDEEALRFLSGISSETYGTLTIIEHSILGPVERVTLLFQGKQDSIGFPSCGIITSNHKDVEKAPFPSMRDFPMDSNKNPLSEPLLSAPMIGTDERSGKSIQSPFYHPYYHSFWPNAHQDRRSTKLTGNSQNSAYTMMPLWSQYRPARAFIEGKSELQEAYDNPILVPSAAALLIGRLVVVRDTLNPNIFHKATVKSQTGSHRFLLVFLVDHGDNEEERSSKAVEATVGDFVDFDNAVGADIVEGDGVLVPCGGVKTESIYVLAEVMEGKELRCAVSNYESLNPRPLKVRLLASGEWKSLERMKALKVPPKLFQRFADQAKCNVSLLSQCNNSNKNHSKSRVSEINEGMKEWYGCSKISEFEKHIIGLGDDKGVSKSRDHVVTVDKDGMSLYDGSAVVSGSVLPHSHKPIYPHGSLKQTPGDVSYKRMDIEERARQLREHYEKEKIAKEKQEAALNQERFDEQSADDEYQKWLHQKATESDPDWSDFSDSNEDDEPTQEPRSRSSSRLSLKKNSSTEDLRPPWRLWGSKPIPDIIDPPTFDPYDPPSDWGYLPERPQVHYTHLGAMNEWSSPNFRVVNPNQLTQTNPYQMFNIMQHKVHQPTPPPRRHVAVGSDNCMWTPQEMRQHQVEKRWHRHITSGGYPNVARLPDSLGGENVRQSMPDLTREGYSPLPRQLSRVYPKMSRAEVQKALDNHNRDVYQRSKEESLPRSQTTLTERKVNFSLPPAGKTNSSIVSSSPFRQEASNQLRFSGESGWMNSAAANRHHSQMARQHTLY